MSDRLPLVSSELAPVLAEDQLESWAEAQRAAGKRIVFTNGCFDLLHPGHIRSIFEAAEHGDVLLVALNSDASVKALKGEDRPFHDEATRALLVSALRAVSAVTIFAAATSLPTILRVRPDVLAKGGEYSDEEIVGAREIAEWGGEVVRLSMVPGLGTTQLLSRMRGEDPRGKEER